MKKLLSLLCIFVIGIQVNAQSLQDMSFGTEATFEIMTWNIEWFPKNGQSTLDSVEKIIEALEVDVLAIQEVDDTIMFKQMVDNLEGYEAYFESGWFAGLAYIYKKGSVQINDIYEIYTTEPYWSAFPRSPMLMDLTFNGVNFVVINNHFKCCGDEILDLDNSDDEEYRRYQASQYLKEYIDTYLPNDKVIVTGDLNDLLTDEPANNVFQNFIDDNENYLFTDMNIASGANSDWSYPSWPSHLDHILITNELFEEFEHENSTIETLKIDEFLSGGFSSYDSNISDHRPVGLRIHVADNGISLNELDSSGNNLNIYPNPGKEILNFSFETAHTNGCIKIISILGEEIKKINVQTGDYSLQCNTENLLPGFYFAEFTLGSTIISDRKVIISK